MHYDKLRRALSDLPIKVYAGADALCDVVKDDNVDMVLAAMVGFAGLKPTISAIKASKAIALANKETLVVAGDLITRLCRQYRVPLLPVDSEPSGCRQTCLQSHQTRHRGGYPPALSGGWSGHHRDEHLLEPTDIDERLPRGKLMPRHNPCRLLHRPQSGRRIYGKDTRKAAVCGWLNRSY